MTHLSKLLVNNGICEIPETYTKAEIDHINAAVDASFLIRSSEKRSYVHVDELQSLGLLDVILGPQMLAVLYAIMPDPVLYHCFAIETAANDPEPNLFANKAAGWHRDKDCSFVRKEPTHVSVFVYLSDVGNDDGPFAFVPQNPERWLLSSAPSILVTGRPGYTFAWSRSFFHRASPNRGSRRRRIIKLSVQRNRYPSMHLENEHFTRAIAALPPGNAALDLLFGRYQGGVAPVVTFAEQVSAKQIAPTGKLAVPNRQLAEVQLRRKASELRSSLRSMGNPAKAAIAYD